jgi:alpha-N-acetylglucosaminidase
MRGTFFAAILLSCFSLGASAFAADASIVVVCGDSVLERHAADEFLKYARIMTGKDLSRRPADPNPMGGVVISVGRNSLSELLANRRLIELPAKNDDSEEVLVQSVVFEKRKYLVVCGSSPKSTLYAVYRYLERVCQVGFFGDGEHVPRMKALPVEGVHVHEQPRYPVREYMMDCEYTSYWWDWSEWQKEVDWAAKHRFNLLSSNFDFTATWRKVWESFGVKVPETSLSGPPFHPWAGWHKWDIRPPYPEAFQDFQADLCRRFTDYGRSLGIKMAPDYRGFLGQVPKEFYEAYRDKARFLDVDWVGFEPRGKFIHPADPLYGQVWRAYLKEYIARFGTDHFYSGMTFSEMVPGETPADQELVKTANARQASEIIRSVDPEARIFSSSWTWLDKRLWPRDSVKAYLDAFPGDSIQIWEQWNDQSASLGTTPMYKELDYYFGKPWLLGFLFSYGGNTTLHGDLKGLVSRVQEVARDPKALRCEGISLQPEALRHNHIWFDLLSRVAWNPEEVRLDTFLADYAARRYGTEAAPSMVRVLQELVASVYGVDDVTPPFYQVRITPGAIENRRKGGAQSLNLEQRSRFIPHLRNALSLALSERGRLGADTLYQHDLIDIARQLQANRFDVEVSQLFEAFSGGNLAAFEQHADTMTGILSDQEALLSSSNFFCLQPILDKAMKLPGVPADFDRAIRDILTVWRGRIVDYARRDYFELVRFYYRPRVDAFISCLRAQMLKGTRDVRAKDLESQYQKIEHAFVDRPFSVGPKDKYRGTPVDAALKILKNAGEGSGGL